jgi:hypothetical protein
MDFEHLRTCFDLTPEDIEQAIESRAATRGLLAHLAEISAPESGTPKVLMVFARLASGASEWIDGSLLVELVGASDTTVVEILSELGAGLRERVFPPIVLEAGLGEFQRALDLAPRVIAPLVARVDRGRIVLSATVAQRRASSLPAIAIDDTSLMGKVRR